MALAFPADFSGIEIVVVGIRVHGQDHQKKINVIICSFIAEATIIRVIFFTVTFVIIKSITGNIHQKTWLVNLSFLDDLTRYKLF